MPVELEREGGARGCGAAPRATPLTGLAARAVAEPGLADDDDGRAPEGRVDVAGGVGCARRPALGAFTTGLDLRGDGWRARGTGRVGQGIARRTCRARWPETSRHPGEIGRVERVERRSGRRRRGTHGDGSSSTRDARGWRAMGREARGADRPTRARVGAGRPSVARKAPLVPGMRVAEE